MGRKWTNIVFELDEKESSIREASSNPRTQHDAVNDYISERWSSDNIPLHENIDVMFGNYSTDKIKSVVSDFFQEFKFINRAAVIYVTDSANIGYGWVFNRDGDKANCVEEYNGYEGAFGEDVSGMIMDDHYIRISPEWCWD